MTEAEVIGRLVMEIDKLKTDLKQSKEMQDFWRDEAIKKVDTNTEISEEIAPWDIIV